MRLQVGLDHVYYHIEWNDESKSFARLKHLIVEKLNLSWHNTTIYYLNDQSEKQVVDNDETLMLYIKTNQRSELKPIYLEKSRPNKLTELTFLKTEPKPNTNNSNANEKGKNIFNVITEDSVCNDPDIEVRPRTKRIQDNNASKIVTMLNRIIKTVEETKTDLDNKIGVLNSVSNDTALLVENMKIQKELVDNKIDKLADNTSVLLNEINRNLVSDEERLKKMTKHGATEKGYSSNCVVMPSESFNNQERGCSQKFRGADIRFTTSQVWLADSKEQFGFASCSKCNSCPIEGDRYACQQCKSFVLCKECHPSNVHKHNLVLIKTEDKPDNYKEHMEFSITQLMQEANNECEDQSSSSSIYNQRKETVDLKNII